MTTTHISNSYTGYSAEIMHKGEKPSISTVRKHLRAAKASGCNSTTMVTQQHGDQTLHLDIVDFGNGPELKYL